MGRRFVAGLVLLVLLVVTLAPLPAQAATHPTLRWGSRGHSVRLVQGRLRAWGFYRGSVDGVYGRRLYGAVVNFQRRHGLRGDGVVGPATWGALGYTGRGRTTARRAPARRAARRAPAQRASRSDDAELLARLVNGEARGEPFEGQVAVAAVIMNRVQDPRFPNTVAGVIYQPHAFESVANGQAYVGVTTSARRAAHQALNGWDPGHGAVFFWNPSKPVSGWIWSRPIIKRIGGHVFAR